MTHRRAALVATALAILACASCSLLANFDHLTPSGSGGGSGGSTNGGTGAGHPGTGAGSTNTTSGTAPETGSTSTMGAGGNGAGAGSTSSGGGSSAGATVQSGVVSLPAGAGSVTATIDSVDLTKAALFFSLSADDPAPGNSQVSGNISDATTVTFARAANAGPAVDVQWYVVRFGSDVNVQRGSIALNTNAEQDVPISPVNLAHAFPMISKRVAGGTYDYNDFTRAELTNTTTLSLSMELSGGDAGGTVEWQVVEYPKSSVQSGTLAFDNAADDLLTATLTAGINPDKSMLLFSHGIVRAHTTTPISSSGFTGAITDANTLTFKRSGYETIMGTDHLTYYLVEFTDSTKVQSGKASFATDANVKLGITPVDLTRSVAMTIGRSGRTGFSDYADDGNPGVNSFTVTLDSPSMLSLTRTVTETMALANWQVVEFQ